jgi:hypothetical protein
MPFKKGDKNAGRLPASREKFKFDFLDETAIPAAIRHLYSVVSGTHKSLKGIRGAQVIHLQNDAAKALLAKAPQRLEGTGDDGSIIVQWLK